MARYALVDDKGAVINVITWDPEKTYKPAAGMICIEDPRGTAEPGGSWDGTRFSPPEPPPPPSIEDVRAREVARINSAFTGRCSSIFVDSATRETYRLAAIDAAAKVNQATTQDEATVASAAFYDAIKDVPNAPTNP